MIQRSVSMASMSQKSELFFPHRLGFVSARSVAFRNGVPYVDAAMGRLIEALRDRSRDLTVALSVAEVPQPLHDHRLELAPGRIVGLPAMPSVLKGFHKFRDCEDGIREVERLSDVTIVQLPFAAPLALRNPAGPRVYHVCADQRKGVRVNRNYRGAKKLLAVATAESIDQIVRRLALRADARVVTHGQELLEHFGQSRGRAVVSSSLMSSEVASVARKRPDDASFRVLFVGYLRPEKGIDVLLQAFARFLGTRPDAELCIVGTKDLDDHGFGADFEQEMHRLAGLGSAKFLGPIGFGPDLFQAYADADVVVVPSRTEGTPRVLVEARAFGTPVIGSEVGGIPASITNEHDGLLVPVNDVLALEKAMSRIASDDALRARLIKNGYERARASTVEAFAEQILSEVRTAHSASR